MDFIEQRYGHLEAPQLRELDTQLGEQIWDTLDFLHALRLGQAAVRNALKDKEHGAAS